MTPNDATPDAPIDRRDYLRLAGGLAAGATAGLAGCAGSVPGGDDGDGDDGSTNDDDGDGSTATGLLSTAVSDDPGDIGDFESCLVTLDGVWVGPRSGSGSESDDEDNSDEEETEETTEANDQRGDGGQPEDANSSSDDEASGSQDDGNQTDTDDGTESDVDEGQDTEEETDEADEEEADDGDGDGESEDGEEEGEEDDPSGRTYYEFDEPQDADLTELQGDAQQLVGEHELAVGTYQFLQLDVAGVRGTLTDDSEAEVTTPGNAPLKFNESFDVREGYRTSFLADFTPVKRGNGSYLFKPVAAETTVSYEEISGGDGSEGGTDSDGSTDGDDSTSGDDATGGGNTSDVDDSETTDGGSADGGGNETTA